MIEQIFLTHQINFKKSICSKHKTVKILLFPVENTKMIVIKTGNNQLFFREVPQTHFLSKRRHHFYSMAVSSHFS